MPETPPPPDILHYFVDEGGDPTLFSGKGALLVGTDGCSRYFILGKLDVDDPDALAADLGALRARLLADPYFKGVPSMQPAEGKTAVAFHAKDDVPEVRREVFNLLARHPVKFYAVVRDKRDLATYVQERNRTDPVYRYRANDQYDSLVGELFSKLRRTADHVIICFAERGSKDRSVALKNALEGAAARFESSFGFRPRHTSDIVWGSPTIHAGLQAVDYFVWALQRFYERGEHRYVELIWPQVGEVHDLDLIEGGRRGVYFRKDKPVTPATRPLK